MRWWWKKAKTPAVPAAPVQERIRQRYVSFRELLTLNNDCLELLATIQEDLQYVSPTRRLLDERVASVFDKTAGVVAALERLTGYDHHSLVAAVEAQRQEVERHVAALEELHAPRLAASLAEVDAAAGAEVGAKASALGEIKNRLKLPVPDGFVLTAHAYRQFCGIPLWEKIRDLTHNVDLNDLELLARISAELTQAVMASPVSRSLEVALTERARNLQRTGVPLAVRSSAVGEGGEKTFAGQFLSLLNVPIEQMVDAYKRVVAGRFSERALFYRLSAGLPEVESPMAVLCLGVIRARAAGILYSRDPKDPKSDTLWITATRGLGLDIASGRVPADLFVLRRKSPHRVVEQSIVRKEEEILAAEEGGLLRRPIPPEEAEAPSLTATELELLSDWALRIEAHFGVPQDIEWVLDERGQAWIVQARPLALIDSPKASRGRIKGEPLLSGGRTIYPGRVSGPACFISDLKALGETPEGAILFLRKASPEIVTVFPRVSGVVAELGNVAGHIAALLREARIPSIFQLPGAFDALKNGDPVSLDAVQPRIYPGTLWSARVVETELPERYRERPTEGDPINRRLLVLHLLDPTASNFRASGCQSAHDVLRFCHEKAIEAMFEVNDRALEGDLSSSKRLTTAVPVNIWVLDLGGGLALPDPTASEVTPPQIVSRPFQALWQGLNHPNVSWKRDMPASLSDLASVMANSLTSQPGATRALGDRSYLLVADEYMNLNSRLAYHFTLVDACVSQITSHNYISFRFAGGGATSFRRNLRACFVESCLSHYGFLVDRRGDLVNAWFKKAPAEETAAKLDIIGRLMACTSQLDMYMTSQGIMKWYVQQFLAGNYAFERQQPAPEASVGQ